MGGERDDSSSTQEEASRLEPWRPKRIIEHGGASGEGLWAAAEIFGSSSLDSEASSLEVYEVIDPRVPLLRSGMEIIERSLSQSKGGIRLKRDQTEEENGIMKEEGEEASEESPHLLSGIKYTFRTPSGSALKNPSTPNSWFSKPNNSSSSRSLPSSMEPKETLSLSSYSLSHLSTDYARQEHVDSLWASGSEVIVLIETSDPRGFSCIASARERLLELGRGEEVVGKPKGWRIGRHVFVEEGKEEEERPQSEVSDAGQDSEAMGEQVEGSHVVAPCPHDKPCPLLHSFLPYALDTVTKEGEEPQVASSPIQRPAGFSICSFSQMLQRPSYLRKTKNAQSHKGGEEGKGYCYVVVRRGQRPDFKHTEGQEGVEKMKMAAERSKKGQLEEIRSGKALGNEVEEILNERDLEIALRNQNSESVDSIQDNLNFTNQLEEELSSDAEGQQNLDNLLPEVLASEIRGQLSQESRGQQLSQEQEKEVQLKVEEILAGLQNQDEQIQEDVEAEKETEAVDEVLPAQAKSEKTRKLEIEDGVEDLEELAMKIESYQWPRLIKPPIKKGGHVIVDSCSSSGEFQHLFACCQRRVL